jgi:hypothetical protein
MTELAFGISSTYSAPPRTVPASTVILLFVFILVLCGVFMLWFSVSFYMAIRYMIYPPAASESVSVDVDSSLTTSSNSSSSSS